MSARKRFIGLVLFPLVACATNTAPPDFLLSPELAQSESWGGWMELEVLQEGTPQIVSGELIAASSDTVWILNEVAGRALPTSAVRTGRLTAYTAEVGKMVGATAAGTVGTAANGLLLVFTAPMWLIGGTAAAAAQSRVPVYQTSRYSWNQIAAFARFPAGMPPGLLLTDLRPKPR